MYKQPKSKINWILPIIVALSLFASTAFALDLATAKGQGLVKETASGYLTAVKQSGEVQALVDDINSRRKVAYQKLAKESGAPLAAVEQRAGERATK